MIASATPESYRRAVEIVLTAEEVDALVVMNTPVTMHATRGGRPRRARRSGGGAARRRRRQAGVRLDRRRRAGDLVAGRGGGERVPVYTFPEAIGRAAGRDRPLCRVAYRRSGRLPRAARSGPRGSTPHLPGRRSTSAGPGGCRRSESRSVLDAARITLRPRRHRAHRRGGGPDRRVGRLPGGGEARLGRGGAQDRGRWRRPRPRQRRRRSARPSRRSARGWRAGGAGRSDAGRAGRGDDLRLGRGDDRRRPRPGVRAADCVRTRRHLRRDPARRRLPHRPADRPRRRAHGAADQGLSGCSRGTAGIRRPTSRRSRRRCCGSRGWSRPCPRSTSSTSTRSSPSHPGRATAWSTCASASAQPTSRCCYPRSPCGGGEVASAA